MENGKIPALLFTASSIFLGYWSGFATSAFDWPPSGLIRSSFAELSDLRTHWRNDIGLEPTRFLVPAAGGPPGFAAVAPDTMAQRYRLVSGQFKERPGMNGAILFDAQGTEVHFWPIDYAALDPGGRKPGLVFLHGLEVFPDGSIVVNFDEGNVIAKIGACGETLWTQHGPFHHAVSKSYDGTIWTLEAERLVQLDPENGSRLRQIDLRKDIIDRNDAVGMFGMRFRDDELNPGYFPDPYHVNDVEILSPDYAGAFPEFDAGDILISLRSLNLVAVIGGEDLRLKWYQHGPWHRQHDPDFQPDGTISVFDNNMHGRFSRIIKIDPVTRHHEIVFSGSEKVPFYTWIRGNHEYLPDGHILVSEPQGGRAFEVDAQGNLVWEYRNVFDEQRNLLLSKVMALPPDYFEADAFQACGTSLVTTTRKSLG